MLTVNFTKLLLMKVCVLICHINKIFGHINNRAVNAEYFNCDHRRRNFTVKLDNIRPSINVITIDYQYLCKNYIKKLPRYQVIATVYNSATNNHSAFGSINIILI